MKKDRYIHELEKLQDRKSTILGFESFHKFAILLPLIEVDGELHILFEVRAHHLRRQPGEICFPGGRIDPEDFNAEVAAVRETCEELGITRHDVTVIVPLDYIVTPFGTVIYPFVGKIQNEIKLKPSRDEVEEVFTVPLSFLLEHEPALYHAHLNVEPEEDFPLDLIPGGKNYKWRIRSLEENFYLYDDKVIWGLTAKILKHFIFLLKNQ